MGTLDIILVSATGASSSLSSAVSLGCGEAANMYDLAITAVICLTVCISLYILTGCIKSIAGGNGKCDKAKEQSDAGTQKPEKNDNPKPQERYDAAWRFFSMCWKVQHPEPMKDKDGKPLPLCEIPALTPEDKARYEEAWSVVRQYISAEASDVKDE